MNCSTVDVSGNRVHDLPRIEPLMLDFIGCGEQHDAGSGRWFAYREVTFLLDHLSYAAERDCGHAPSDRVRGEELPQRSVRRADLHKQSAQYVGSG